MRSPTNFSRSVIRSSTLAVMAERARETPAERQFRHLRNEYRPRAGGQRDPR
jgi:hypothetical protein